MSAAWIPYRVRKYLKAKETLAETAQAEGQFEEEEKKRQKRRKKTSK